MAMWPSYISPCKFSFGSKFNWRKTHGSRMREGEEVGMKERKERKAKAQTANIFNLHSSFNTFNSSLSARRFKFCHVL